MNRATKDKIKALPIVRSLYAALMRHKDRQYQKSLVKRNQALKTNGEQVVAAIDRLLAGEGITFFYDYGSLLGIVREGHFLGHDTDMDISCNVKDEAAFAEVAAILDKKLIPAGFQKKHDIYMGEHLSECTYMYMGVSIDFIANVVTEEESYNYLFYRTQGVEYTDGNETTVWISKKPPVTQTVLQPLGNIHVHIPQNAEEVLTMEYGEDWRVPNPDWNDIVDAPHCHRDDSLRGHYEYAAK